MAAEVKQYGRAKLVAGTSGGPGNIGSGEAVTGLNPFFIKDGARTEVFVPFADAVGFIRFAAGDAASLEIAGKTLLAAARFAEGSADTES